MTAPIQPPDPAAPALLGMPPAELERVTNALALPRYAAKQLADWMYKKFAPSFDAMSNISKNGRAALAEHTLLGASAPENTASASDGTKKYLFRTLDDHFVESVYIPEEDRATLCLSTQAGCRMGCRFCMTARQGLEAQLAPADILNQYYSLPERGEISNIVYMGMGEPLDNLDAVLASIAALTAPWGMAMSPRRITVSTCGILAGLERLLAETEVHVALSLHNPFDTERARLMPVALREPLEPIFALLKRYNWRGQRRLTLEYMLFEGYNDNEDHRKQLVRLTGGLGNVRVNLLAWNPLPAVAPQLQDHAKPDAQSRSLTLAPASLSALEDFQAHLNAAGVIAPVRRSRGGDIASACGLLSTQNKTVGKG
ncbi:MAG: radical SAM protein [Spirochaetota bacterium]|jgi:23S rRNA (adenine2503-C2)-methyltransferase|nr:radical SAM protein [Spirochaetota bacterium]